MNSVTVGEIYGTEAEAEADEVARLPGEDADHAGIGEHLESPEQHGPDGLSAEPRAKSSKPSKGNVALYAGVGLVALLMAGGYFYLRPVATPHLMVAAQAPSLPPPLAPAASLAKVPVPHLPASVIHPKFVPQPVSTQLSELDALHAGDQGTTPGVAPTHVSSGSGQAPGPHRTLGVASLPPGNAASDNHPAAATTMMASNAVTAPKPASTSPGSPGTEGTAVSLRPALPSPVALVAHAGNSTAGFSSAAQPALTKPAGLVPAVVTQPASATLAAAQAGTLSAAQQTNLYQLVTQLGSLERSDEIRQAVLAGQVQQLTLLMSGKMADYDRRLSMLEAQTAVSGAVQAASGTAVSSAIAAAPAPAPAPTSSQGAAAPAPSVASPAPLPSSAPSAPVQYQVQAASPGLAMLSAPGGGQPIEVQTGDSIPGYGKVLGVIQQGASWIVQTQSGNIE